MIPKSSPTPAASETAADETTPTAPPAGGDEALREASVVGRTAFRVIVGAIGATVVVTLAVIIVTLNRGFDWSDEGFIYAMIASNRIADGEFWGFQHLLNPIYELLGSSVLSFRILRLLGYLALSGVLVVMAHGMLSAIGTRLRRSTWLFVVLVAQIGTFAAWSYPPRYLGYNELSSWLTQLGGALLILLLVRGRWKAAPLSPRVVWTLWAFVGVVLSALFFAKVTAAIVLGAFALLVALLPGTGRRWARIGFLAIGAAVAILVMFATGVPVVAYAQSVFGLILNPSAQSASGYSVSGLMPVYLASASVTINAIVVPVILAAVTLLVSRGASQKSGASTTTRFAAPVDHLAMVLGGVLLLIVLTLTVYPQTAALLWEALGATNTFMMAVAIIAFALLSPRDVPPGSLIGHRTTTTALMIILFVLTPIISGVGTNTPLFGHTVFSSTLWAVGVGVGLALLWERSTASSPLLRMFPLLLAAALVAGSGLAIAGDVFHHPYRTAPYFAQKFESTTGDFRGLRLTEPETELLEWLDDTGEQLDAAGVPALSLARPGALLAFNASGWANPWPAPDWADSIARSCETDPPEDLFVLQSGTEKPGSPNYEQLETGLEACGIEFPEDFEVVAEHESDDPIFDVRVWQLR